MVKRKYKNRKKCESNNLRNISISIILFLLFLLTIYFCSTSSNLSNDKEVVELRLEKNINYVKYIIFEIKPSIFDQKGANYNINFSDIDVKNDNETSLILLYFRKRLPLNTSINCIVINPDGTKVKCSNTELPSNTIKDTYSIPEQESGSFSPLQIEHNLLKDDSSILVSYSCPSCNPGGFELEIQDKPNIYKIYLSLLLNKVWLIQDYYESGTKAEETKQNYDKLTFEGKLYEFEKNDVNRISIRVNAKNFIKEVLFWISISTLAGLIVYWISFFFNKQ